MYLFPLFLFLFFFLIFPLPLFLLFDIKTRRSTTVFDFNYSHIRNFGRNETFLFFFPFKGITKIFLRNTRLFIGRERTDYRTIRGSRYNVPESKFERTFFQNLLHRANRISILSLFNFLLRVFNGLKYRFLESIIHTTYI